ncbi:MAG TPA: NAD(P)/FAD-dependent oxidoreductase [Thermoplasmata archaeon]|nr:NAD(P)/FAD-dependent oxidoreductase [Thermoplasmata archaeon]
MPDPANVVLILGAGAAGLACAERLLRAGIPCTILEARERIGGRAFTDYALTPELPLELGAQMVHGRHVVTHQWAREVGLTTRAWPVSQRALFSLDRRLLRFPWLALPGYPGFGLRAFYEGSRGLPRRMQGLVPPDRSLARFLDEQAPSLGARRLVELLHAHVYAADPDEIGVRGPAEEERRAGEGFGYRNFQLREGYSELFRRRSAPFRDRIRLGVQVTAVRRSGHGVAIEARTGGKHDAREVFLGRAAVVTFPLGVLSSGTIDFDPPLPPAKQEAIRRIAFGMGYALQLRLSGGDLTERYGDFSVVWAGGATTFHRPGVRRRGLPEVITAFTVGRDAKRRASMGSPERIEATLDELSSALPEGARIGQVDGHSVQLWSEDPFARGAYSFLPVGLDPSARQTLAQPVDNELFFAGEATNWEGESATIHGAIETGYRAAEEVRRRFAGPPVAGSTLE